MLDGTPVTTAKHIFVPMQRPALAVVAVIAAGLFVYLFEFGPRKPWLFVTALVSASANDSIREP